MAVLAIVIGLPQVGQSVTEGIISKWLKKPGDYVEKYDPLLEVMTDKVNMEVPSPHSGTLTKILVAEGDSVPMGSPIAEMETADDVQPGPTKSKIDHDGRVGEFLDSVRSVGPTGSGEGGQGMATIPEPASSPVLRPSVEKQRGLEGKNAVSPVVRRLLEKHNLDVSKISGSGSGGRVTRDDVLNYVLAQNVSEPSGDPSISSIKLTPMRKAIADHMTVSSREIPVAWTMVEVDVSGIVAFRDSHKKSFIDEHGAPLTYLSLVAHTVARALRNHLKLNSRWAEDRIIQNPDIELGIAVSTVEGLIVPVVHDADKLSITELALRIHHLAEMARSGRLRLEDVQGGTFTLNNTGALGSVVSFPIINHPQVAILTSEAVVKRPVVMGDDIKIRSIMNLCLAFDHRVCDGGDAAPFLNEIKDRLEAITAEMPLK